MRSGDWSSDVCSSDLVGVRHRPDRAHAVAADVALLARAETHDDQAAIPPDNLRIGAGGPGDLAALARLHLDIVDDGADRHLRQFHRIARLHVGLLARNDRVADAQTLRRQYVGDRAVLIFDEGDERRAVRVIFQTLDGGRHVPLATLEAAEAVIRLVSAGATARDRRSTGRT